MDIWNVSYDIRYILKNLKGIYFVLMKNKRCHFLVTHRLMNNI
jgi:hypothetical protein